MNADHAGASESRRRRLVVVRLVVGVLLVASLVGTVYLATAAADSQPGQPGGAIPSAEPTTVLPDTASAKGSGAVASPEGLASTDEYPDYTPMPDRVPTARVRQIADSVLGLFPQSGLVIDEAIEMRYPDTNVTQIELRPRKPGEHGAVSISIFRNPETTLRRESIVSRESGPSTRASRPAPKLVEDYSIPGATETYLVEMPEGAGWQLLAQLPDRMVINVSSGILKPEYDGNPPLDRASTERLVLELMKMLQK